MKKFFIISAFAAMMLGACSSVDCRLESKVMCHIAIQKADGTPAELAYPLTVTLNSTATEGDTTFINQMAKVSTLSLPLSYASDADKITLSLTIDETTTISDVVTLGKTNQPLFESVDCQPRYKHQLTGISSTHNFIDTIIINNDKVSNDASVTNIYLRVRN